MSLAIIYSRAQIGVEAPLITVETHLSNGLPAFTLVGLPETSVKESKDRVRSAILNSGFEFPNRRITLNLAPADLPKDGGRFDLAIAMGILAGSNSFNSPNLQNYEFLGELALSGEIRAVQGVLPAAIACRDKKRILVICSDNAEEASMAKGVKILVANNLNELITCFTNNKINFYQAKGLIKAPEKYADLADVQGQQSAKRALLIAAAGGHNLLFSGPPGTGKTLLASRLPGILPELNENEAQEVASIHSLVGVHSLTSWPNRPFRSPHHSSSSVALVGGGSKILPGEITLAHHGVLFLDELPEFDRKVLEVLREPIENGHILIARAKQKVLFPANFQLIAAMNPCPCGFLGEKERNGNDKCKCSASSIERYRNKLSGPLLDRIDLHQTVNRETTNLSKVKNTNERTSKELSEIVEKARKIQLERQNCTNANIPLNKIYDYCLISNEDKQFLENTCERMQLSLRAAHRILKVARTIADLDFVENNISINEINQRHLKQALQYRPQHIKV